MFELDDITLLGLLKESNEAAFTEIFRRYWKKLYAIAYNRLKMRPAAEDVVQEVLASLWLRRTELHIQKLSHYLAIATRYAVYRQVDKILTSQLSEHDEIMDAPSIGYDYRFLQACLQKEIDQLPEKCRLVFVYSRQYHMSNREIADSLHLSEKTVQAHMTKALKQLRSRLKDAYIFLPFLF